jgi:23S rRNA-/tRNA-specific pseudouridylate synthase
MQASKTLVSPAQQPKVGDIRAIYQDKALVVLNKPSGLVSQVDHTLDKADMEKAFTGQYRHLTSTYNRTLT